MKRIRPARLLILSFIILMAASCNGSLSREEPSTDEGKIVVSFVPGNGQTRVAGATKANEERIVRWALFLFDENGKSMGTGLFERTSDSQSPVISLSVNPGTYTACAMVNYSVSGPAAFTPSGSLTRSMLRSTMTYLQENAYNALQMYGEKSFDLTATSGTKSIPVDRLVSKVSIGQVRLQFSNPALAAAPFVLRRIFLSNVCETMRYGTEYEAASDLDWTRSRWYNTCGYHTAGSGYRGSLSWTEGQSSALDALTIDELNVSMTNGQTLAVNRTFYCAPNPTTDAEDTHRDEDWSSSRYRETRLVIETSLNGTVYYYVISMEGMRRNKSYQLSSLTIVTPGSTDPEEQVDGAVDVTFAVDPDDWTGPIDVEEDS